QVRSDMAERMSQNDWALLPTKKMFDAMNALSHYNKTAHVHNRKRFTEELPEQDYEYEFLPIRLARRDRPLVYFKRGLTTRTVNRAYSKMPRIRSSAHPLFHNPSIYDRARQGTKLPKSPALPRSTRASEAGSSDSNPDVNFSPTDLREWLDSITPTLSDKTEVRSPRPSSSTGDAALTRYHEEPARDPANALHGTLLVTHAECVDASDGLQRSVYCSNNWAWHVYHQCLWSSSPPQKARFGHVDLRVA
ncbi:hypothetical protein FB107DRAFT_215889, partial [Schizophyllum commune]